MAKKAEEKDPKKARMEEAVKGLSKVFGKNILRKASEISSGDISRITTGSVTLDRALNGGYRVGRVHELCGYESTCKTLMALKAVIYYQEAFPDLDVCWVDNEGSWDAEWASRIGVDADRVFLSVPETGEQAFDVMDVMTRTGNFSLVVLDSLGMASPTGETEKSMDKVQPGMKARMGNKGTRKLQSAMNYSSRENDVDTSVIIINHIYLDIGGFFAKKVTPGGKGKDYADSCKIEFMVKDHINLSEEEDLNRPQVGVKLGFYLRKSKISNPLSEGSFVIYTDDVYGYRCGEISVWEYIPFLIQDGHIQRAGSWYTMPDGTRVQGEEAVASALREIDEEELARYKRWIVEKRSAEVVTDQGQAPEVAGTGEQGS